MCKVISFPKKSIHRKLASADTVDKILADIRVSIPELYRVASPTVIKAASDFYHKSDTAHYVERLDEIINQQGYKMSNWEVEQLNSMYEKFSAQYNSPLAKALK